MEQKIIMQYVKSAMYYNNNNNTNNKMLCSE